jgi:DNA-binding NtrC family response regulator
MSMKPSNTTSELSPRVLVVEDEPRMRDVLTRAVSEMGIPVQCARSAEEALKTLSRQGATILLLDLNLPGLSGLEFLEQARAQHPYLQAIVLTGFGSLEAAKSAIRLDVVDFLTKPFVLDDLDAALSRAQHRLRTLSLQRTDPHASGLMSGEDDDTESPPPTLEEIEREHIHAALSRHNGNRAAVARELGISERTLYYRLGRYQLRRQPFTSGRTGSDVRQQRKT